MKQMKKRILSMLLALVTLLTILPTAAFAANSTGTGITPVTDPNLWTTRLNSSHLCNLVCRLLLEKTFFNDTATTEIYTKITLFPYTTLFDLRCPAR